MSTNHRGSLKIVITGFGPFQGVAENPTTVLCAKLRSRCALTDSQVLLSTSVHSVEVLRTSGKAVDAWVHSQTQQLLTQTDANDTVVFLHLGVDSKASGFKLESRGYNIADFRCPDEDDWMPAGVAIKAKPLRALLHTDIDLEALQSCISRHGSFNDQISLDAGRFVCNYLYFSSLVACLQQADRSWHALFLHVPPFERIDLEGQLKYIDALLRSLDFMYTRHAAAMRS